MRLDYKLLHAFSTVIKCQSFEKAATELYISQPAVSQRIKQLEQTIGQPVIIRSSPIQATEIGKLLLGHYRQVEQLEAEVMPSVFPNSTEQTVEVNIATNADSLATWLIEALSNITSKHDVEYHLQVANENNTLDMLRNGEVFGAISTSSCAPSGCNVTKLGSMKYILVANKEFKQRYFKDGVNYQTLLTAPATAYDHKDNLHFQFIESHFGVETGKYPCHTVRSSEAFINFAKNGAAYCMIPQLQIVDELASGSLIEIAPDICFIQDLYWHSWVLAKGLYKEITNEIVQVGQKRLSL